MRYRFQHDGRVYEINLEPQGPAFRAIVDGQAYGYEVLDAQPGQLSLRFEGRPITVYYAARGGQTWLSMSGCTYRLEKPAPSKARSAGEQHEAGTVRAPMPSQVRSVQVEAGQQVEKGQTLLLLEAMKMELRVRAPDSGKVKRVLVTDGQTVDKEQPLVEMEA
jgi:biotin carboxyl carrier protein